MYEGKLSSNSLPQFEHFNNHSHGGGFNSEKGQATTPTNL